jgi:hypothetical protein
MLPPFPLLAAGMVTTLQNSMTRSVVHFARPPAKILISPTVYLMANIADIGCCGRIRHPKMVIPPCRPSNPISRTVSGFSGASFLGQAKKKLD